MNLDLLAEKYGTDKGPSGHGYTALYNKLFAHLENEPFTLLEIGILKGASLRMWREAFPEAFIMGIDIDSQCNGCPGAVTFIANQGSPFSITNIAEQYPPDVVIDDGSHATSDQLISLLCILPYMPSGGIYVIEDLDPKEHPTHWLLSHNNKVASMLGVSVEMTDELAILRKP